MPNTPSRSFARWALLILGGAVVAGLLAAHPLAEWTIRQWATSQGITLNFQRLHLETGLVVLENVEVQLPALEKIQVSASQAMFHVKHWQLESLHLESPQLTFQGTPQEAMQRLPSWLQTKPLPFGIPVTNSPAYLIGKDPKTGAPWGRIEGASFQPSGQGYQIQFQQLQAEGVSLPGFQFFWNRQPDGYEISFVEPPNSSPLQILFFPNAPEPALRLNLRRTPASALTGWGLSVSDSIKKVEVEGSIEVGLVQASPKGKLKLDLYGYTPPHPPEVDALVRSERTSVEAEVQFFLQERVIDFTKISATTGKLRLQGTGKARLPSTYATFKGSLQGALPCREIARTAANSTLDGFLGEVAVGLTGLLQGSVQLSVQIEADSRNLAAASLQTNMTPRCSISF